MIHGKKILEIKRDVGGLLIVKISNENGNVGWQVSKDLEKLLLKEMKNHLGGEFTKEFDPVIREAIETLRSCE
jgi:hypothetical protein